MNFEEAQRRLCDKIKTEMVARYGEAFYDQVLAGHVLAESVKWFTPYLLDAPVPTRKGPVTPLGELDEVARLFAKNLVRPVLEVECGLGSLAAALGLERAIDRDERQIQLAQAAFPQTEFHCNSLDAMTGEGTYGSILTAFGLGRMDPLKGMPIFLDFVAHSTRLLRAGGLVLVAERASFQDNLVEPLVAHDYEILKLQSLPGTKSVLIVAQRP